MKEIDTALIKVGAMVQTRSGKAARIICTDKKGLFPVVALIDDGDTEITQGYTSSGYVSLAKSASELDLVATPVKHNGYVNIHRADDGERYVYHQLYPTREVAERCGNASASFVASVEVNWKEE